MTQHLFRILDVVDQKLHSSIWLASIVLFILIYYLLRQRFSFRCLGFFMAAEIINLLQWFWYHRLYFSSFPPSIHDVPAENYFLLSCIAITTVVLRCLPTFLYFIGGISLFRYLRKTSAKI